MTVISVRVGDIFVYENDDKIPEFVVIDSISSDGDFVHATKVRSVRWCDDSSGLTGKVTPRIEAPDGPSREYKIRSVDGSTSCYITVDGHDTMLWSGMPVRYDLR